MSSTQSKLLGADIDGSDDSDVGDLSSSSTETSSTASEEPSSPIELESLIRAIFSNKQGGLSADASNSGVAAAQASEPTKRNLFYLDTEPRDTSSLINQLQGFVTKYDLREPRDLESAYVHAESLGRVLRATLPPSQFVSLLGVFNSCCVQWIHALLKFPATTVGVMPQSMASGRIGAARAALARKFPDFETKGFLAFGSTTPTIYATIKYPFLEELCAQLGLPKESLRAGDDIVAMIESDIGRNRTPFFVYTSLGDEKGHYDDILRVRAVARNENIWMHVEGESTVLLAMKEPPKSIAQLYEADSIQMNACNLLGLDKYHCPVLFFRSDAGTHPEDAARTTTASPSSIIDASGIRTSQVQMGIWMSLHLTGRSRIVESISNAHRLVSRMHTGLSENPHIHFHQIYKATHLQITFRYEPALETAQETQDAVQFKRPRMSLSGSVIIYPTPRPVRRGSKSSQSDTSPSTPAKNAPNQDGAPATIPEASAPTAEPGAGVVVPPVVEAVDSIKQISEEIRPHLNEINQQILSDILSSLGADLIIDTVTEEGESFLRFRPFFQPNVASIREETVATFCDNLFIESNLIASFLSSRPAFRKAVATKEGLLPVTSAPPNLLGLGTVRYRPIFLAAVAGPAKEGEKMAVLIDDLNKAIVAKLRETNPMYINAKTDDGHECIGVNIDTEPMTPALATKQVDLIYETAMKVELDMKIFDRVGEIVRQFVKETEATMKKESEELRSQTGLIRKIPIVGSMWNWWSPVRDPRKGKKFDLVATSLEEPTVVRSSISRDESVHSSASDDEEEEDEESESYESDSEN